MTLSKARKLVVRLKLQRSVLATFDDATTTEERFRWMKFSTRPFDDNNAAVIFSSK